MAALHNHTHPGMGWLPDRPDVRDYTSDHDQISPEHRVLGQKDSVRSMLHKAGVVDRAEALPPSIDLRSNCPPIEDQGAIGSCTAHAGVGLVEFYERRAFGKHVDASRLFLYKTTRDLLHWQGDTGAFLRTTMKAMVTFGVAPEEYMAYDVAQFDKEPTAFCYAFGQGYRTLNYYRLDPPGVAPPALLERIKAMLARRMPSMFGFTVYDSYRQAEPTGLIPFPAPVDRIVGGHAVDAVGYDDAKKIKNAAPGSVETTGALLIRNSWGTGWGDGGYGWLPYEYVLRGLAVDWWSVLKQEWVDSEAFSTEETSRSRRAPARAHRVHHRTA